PAFLLLLLLSVIPAQAQELTPEQIESLKARLKSIKENLSTHLTVRNTSAGQAFLNAAGDPRPAVELYLNCVKAVDYDRQGRPEADFKAWRAGQEERLRGPAFSA